jgi:hypothetical protein
MENKELRNLIREGFEDTIKEMVNEEEKSSRYMFISNLKQMCQQAKELLEYDEEMLEDVLNNGHDWAADHVATAKESLDQVYDFFKNKNNSKETESDEEQELEEGNGISQTIRRGMNKKPINYRK